MRIRLHKFSYRFAEQVLNSKLVLKQEIEDVLMNPEIDIATLSRPNFKKILKMLLSPKNGGISQPFLMKLEIRLLEWIS